MRFVIHLVRIFSQIFAVSQINNVIKPLTEILNWNLECSLGLFSEKTPGITALTPLGILVVRCHINPLSPSLFNFFQKLILFYLESFKTSKIEFDFDIYCSRNGRKRIKYAEYGFIDFYKYWYILIFQHLNSMTLTQSAAASAIRGSLSVKKILMPSIRFSR